MHPVLKTFAAQSKKNTADKSGVFYYHDNV